MQRNVLVVASKGEVRESLGDQLRKKGFVVTLAENGTEALRVVRSVTVDTVVIETHLSDMRADKLAAQLREVRPECRVLQSTHFGTVRNTPALFQFGVNDYLLHSDEFVEVLTQAMQGGGDAGDSTSAARGKNSLLEVIDVLVGLLEVGDQFFGGGSHQAMKLARSVAEEMAVGQESLEEIILATLLRDIGRAGLDSKLFAIRGPLGGQQRDRMKDHVTGSLRLLDHIDFPWKVLPVIRHHHERYDGKGYPDGLRGREIPLGARIVAVVDAYIAMVSERPHRTAMTPENAQRELMHHAGTQFDPEIVEVLLRVFEKRRGPRDAKKKLSILVVDPQEDFRNLLKMRLLNDGFEIQAVGTPAEAFDKCAKTRPDIVLADIRGDGSEGFKFLRDFREENSLRNVPFAFLSSREDRVLKVRALRQGVDDFLLKSTELEELAARIDNILIRESARREGASMMQRRGITGQLENMPLPDIVQTLAIGMKTACVTLTSAGAKGTIWFEEGAIRHAWTVDAEGDHAFFEMVRWKSGEFVIEHGVKTRRVSITLDAMYLLMEAFRLIDEESEVPEEEQKTEEEKAVDDALVMHREGEPEPETPTRKKRRAAATTAS